MNIHFYAKLAAVMTSRAKQQPRHARSRGRIDQSDACLQTPLSYSEYS